MLTSASARGAFDAAAATVPDYPGGFEGRGIVIPGGGPVYFPGAWVAVCRLRELGCALPIELWHIGPRELSPSMRALIEPLGVRCVDALEVLRRHPVRRLRDWELKPYAALHSRFREVLLMDADDVPLVDPAFLFDQPEYRRTGAVFWADGEPIGPDEPIWPLTGVPYRDEPSFESCQFVVDKSRCWAPLALAMWMNQHSDFWYRHIYGDKDTFHFAWRKLGVEYAMPDFPLMQIPFTNCHRDFDGRVVFLHRCADKWRLESPNRRIPGFSDEGACLRHLEILSQRWIDRPNCPYRAGRADARAREVAGRLMIRPWRYRRGSVPSRIELAPEGRIGEGASDDKVTWGLHHDGRRLILTIAGQSGITCRLAAAGPQRWLGRCRLTRTTVELAPPG